MAKECLFDVNAGQILAKLHIAGLQAASPSIGGNSENLFIVNTGIQDDDPKAKPDDPKGVKFNLSNSSGKY